MCFRRNGAFATRMDDVADEAGLQRPNLYRYFPSRDALIGAVIVREIEITNAERTKQIPLRGPVGPVLVKSLALGHDIAISDETTQHLLVAEMRDATSAIVAAEQTVMEAESQYWRPVLSYGRARGEVNPDLSDARIIRWFLTSQVLVSTRPEMLDGLADSARDFFEIFVVPPVLSSPRS